MEVGSALRCNRVREAPNGASKWSAHARRPVLSDSTCHLDIPSKTGGCR